MAGKTHHQTRRYRLWAARVRAAAQQHPAAVCSRDGHGNPCGRLLSEHPKGAVWTAGHTVAGSNTWAPWMNATQVAPAGDWLAPQASTCNFADGARLTNTRRNPTTETW